MDNTDLKKAVRKVVSDWGPRISRRDAGNLSRILSGAHDDEEPIEHFRVDVSGKLSQDDIAQRRGRTFTITALTDEGAKFLKEVLQDEY